MNYCGYITIAISVVLYFYWLLADINTFKQFSPPIYRISPHQKLFSSNDPPLYRALMEGLEPYADNTIMDTSKLLFNANMFAAAFRTPNSTNIEIFTIRSDIPTNISHDPYHSEISINSKPIFELISNKSDAD